MNMHQGMVYIFGIHPIRSLNRK